MRVEGGNKALMEITSLVDSRGVSWGTTVLDPSSIKMDTLFLQKRHDPGIQVPLNSYFTTSDREETHVKLEYV